MVEQPAWLSTLVMVLHTQSQYMKASQSHMLLKRTLSLVEQLLIISSTSLLLMEFLKDPLVNQLGNKLSELLKNNFALSHLTPPLINKKPLKVLN
jgi:hypothetical protein